MELQFLLYGEGSYIQEQNFFSKFAISGTCKTGKMDLVFVLDGSGSVSDSDFALMTKNFTTAVVDAMDINSGKVRIANIVYSSSVYVKFNFNMHTTKHDTMIALYNTVRSKSIC